MISVVDYVVLLVCVGLTLGTGMFVSWFKKGQSSSIEYFLGGKSLNAVPVAFSLVVTFQSTIMILGYPAEVYIYGISHLLSIIGAVATILLTNIISVPVFYNMKLTSVFEYVNKRFGTNSDMLRYWFVFLELLRNILYMAIVLLGPGYAIEALTGVPVWMAIIVSSFAAVTYTSLGGMRAVIWADTLQFFIIVAGMMAIVCKAASVVGGFGIMIEINREYGRTNMFDFNPDPTVRQTFWSLIIGSFFWSITFCFSQQTVQRFNSTRTISEAKKVILITAPLFAFLTCLAHVCGFAAFAFYTFSKCDPLESGRINNPNQIIVAIISDLFVDLPGLAGLVLAAIWSASLSTLSSGFNSFAAISNEEIFRHKFQDIAEKRKLLIAKVSVFFYGFLSTALSLTMMSVKGSLSQIGISFMGAIGAPATGMFLLAILYRGSTIKGVLVGSLVGLIISLWISLGYSFSTSLPETPWLPPGPITKCNVTASSVNDSVQEIILQSLPNSSAVTTIYQSTTEVTTLMRSSSTTTDKQHIRGFDIIYSLSYHYFALLGVAVTILVGLAVNLCTKNRENQQQRDPDGVLNLCCCKRKPSSQIEDDNLNESFL